MPPLLRLAPAAVTVAVVALVAAPRAADACSPWPCNWDGSFVPGDGATVPANLPAIYWRPRADVGEPDPALVTLTTAADPGTPLSFTAIPAGTRDDYLLVLDAPLVPGTQYVLGDGHLCSEGSTTEPGPRVTFTAGPEAPLPTTLGMLDATPLGSRVETIATQLGLCFYEVETASARVAVELAASDAAPWRDVFLYETWVDGRAWGPRSSILDVVPPGESWDGRGADRVFAGCRVVDDSGLPLPGLAEGTHQVELRATLPGTDVALATAPVSVALDCGGGGGGCSATTGAGAPWLVGLGLALLVATRARRSSCR